MKLIISVFIISLMVLQISCGPRTSAYRGSSSYKPSLVDVKTGFNDALFSENILHIRKFIASGVDINSKVESGMYPLDYAARFNKVESLKFLLKNGANPNLINPANGQTPLFSSASMEIIQILLQHGADANIKDKNNKTAADVVDRSLQPALRVDANLFGSVKQGDLKTYINSKTPLSKKDYFGNTALHVAAQNDHKHIVAYLLKRGIALNAKNKKGETALDLAKNIRSALAKLLSCRMNSYCKSVKSFEKFISSSCSNKATFATCQKATSKDLHGVFTSNKLMARMEGIEYKTSCEKFSYIKCYGFTQKYSGSKYFNSAQLAIENFRPRGMSLFAKSCGNKGKTKNCKEFIANHPGLIEESKAKHAFVYLNQKCRVNEDGWIYQGRQCKGNWVHGEGKSVNSEKNLSFIGLYRNGNRVKGLLSYNNQPMFDGVISNGRPNGEGICFYKGDPEKCEFYKGKRVDVLYKQRIAMAKQQEQMDKKLAEMKSMQEQQNARINQIQGQVRSNRNQVTNKSSGGIGQQIGDYALKKAGEKVMDSLFDRLF